MPPLHATRTDRFFIPVLLFVLALVLRLFWTWHTHSPTLDTAVVGLMALDIQSGARPLFFTGQGYMGALEAYLTAGMFSLFGSDRFTMTFAPSLFGALWPVFMFWILRTSFSRRAAMAGAMMIVFPAGYILRYSSVPYGGYPGTYVFGSALVLHVLVRILQQKVFPWKDALIFSILLFLGVWTNLQIVPYLAAASAGWLWLLWKHWRSPSVWLPFALAPLAFGLALVPQMLLSAQNPASPPLFSSLSGEQVVRSVRALITFDVPQLVQWKDSSPRLGLITGWSMGILVLAGLTNVLKCRKSLQPLLWLSVCFLLTFSLLYFPHSMSGFVPRYVIAPFAWVVAVAVAGAVHAEQPLMRKAAFQLWLVWVILQSIQLKPNMDARKAKLDEKMAEIHAVIDTARDLNLEALRFIGSGMEGHRAAAFAFEAKQDPVFVSSYDERRRDADLQWHASDRAGYFFTEAFEPFVRGSLQAMQVEAPDILTADRFRVMAMPEVTASTVELMPRDEVEVITDLERDSDGIIEIPAGGGRITFQFDSSVLVSGLRLSAPPDSSLPYQVSVQAVLPDGSQQEVAQTSQRLGTSYLDGGRVYFKGVHEVQDIRWTALEAAKLHLDIVPGRLNKLPVRLESLAVCREIPDQVGEIDWEALVTAMEAAPEATVITPDAWASRIRREERGRLGDQLHRIPLPWNPRDPESQPPRFDVELAQGLLLLNHQMNTARTCATLEQANLPFNSLQAGALSVLYVSPVTSEPVLKWSHLEVLHLQN